MHKLVRGHVGRKHVFRGYTVGQKCLTMRNRESISCPCWVHTIKYPPNKQRITDESSVLSVFISVQVHNKLKAAVAKPVYRAQPKDSIS